MDKHEHIEELEEDFSSSDYADYYDAYYSGLDEQEIERERDRRSGLFSRSRMYVEDIQSRLTDEISGTIDLQKEYYSQSENHFLYHEQINRNKIFYRQLLKFLITGAVLIGILYLFLLIGS